MTFKTWYEEVVGKTYSEISPEEKIALEGLFLKYLRMAWQDDTAALCSQEKTRGLSPSLLPGKVTACLMSPDIPMT